MRTSIKTTYKKFQHKNSNYNVFKISFIKNYVDMILLWREIMSNIAKSYQMGNISSLKKDSRQIWYNIAIFEMILLDNKIIMGFLSDLSSFNKF